MTNFSSKHHSFDIDIAEKYGIEEAILIHYFEHWISLNKKLKQNFHEGRTWTYQTLEQIAAHFSYLSKNKVQYILEKLCTGKPKNRENDELDFEPILMKGNFNKSAYDRTVWYAFVNDSPSRLENSNIEKGTMQNGDMKSATPIPVTTTVTKEIKEKEKEKEASPFPPPPPSSKFSKDIFTYTGKHSGKTRVWAELSKYERLLQEIGREKLDEMMERLDEYADINPKRFKQYACHVTVIRKWIREEGLKKGMPQKRLETDQILLNKLKKYSETYPALLIDCGADYVVFSKISPTTAYKIGEAGFKEKIISCLRKMNVNVTEERLGLND